MKMVAFKSLRHAHGVVALPLTVDVEHERDLCGDHLSRCCDRCVGHLVKLYRGIAFA